MPRMDRAGRSRGSERRCFNGASASMPRMVLFFVLLVRAPYASTGPRHRCRGWRPAAWRGWRRRGSLQRGLGIDAEDGNLDDVPDCRRAHASTGPRHRCRGWRRRTCRARRSGSASTGPRHRCRGWWGHETALGSACLLQRGLGIDAEDGIAQMTKLAPSTPRFNGASASMPRMVRGSDRGARHGEASTGPRHRCRGWRCGLQTRRVSSIGFNGASASMPRMAGDGVDGQDFFAPASTGPRHRCRGWRQRVRAVNPPLPLLQRGLGIDAEDGWGPSSR